MHDVVGGGEVEALAPGPQADQEHVPAAGLERVHAILALGRGGRPVQVLVVDPLAIQDLAHQGQVAHELAEDQQLVPAGAQVAQQLLKRLQLGAGHVALREHQPGVAAGPPQLHQLGEHQELGGFAGVPVARRVPRFAEAIHRLLAQRLVKRGLSRVGGHGEQHLGARRQLLQHLALGAAQDERPHHPP